MKIAIFHNALDNIGGAEIVDLIMARELNADIYTTNIDTKKIIKRLSLRVFLSIQNHYTPNKSHFNLDQMNFKQNKPFGR